MNANICKTMIFLAQNPNSWGLGKEQIHYMSCVHIWTHLNLSNTLIYLD